MKQQQLDEDQVVAIERLKKVIEAKVGRKIQTPKDFDYLSACITEELHEPISVSTLKRLWGYIQSSGSPRLSTLDMLAHEIPLGRLGRPEEIAETILHLASAGYTTGQVFSVDGGFII